MGVDALNGKRIKAGDYFTKDTDLYDGKSIPVLYDHGLDPQLKRRKLGRATLIVDDAGVGQKRS